MRSAIGVPFMWLAVLLAASWSGWAREPAVGADLLQEAQIVGLAELPGGQGAAVGLRVADDERIVAIFIGSSEAAAIARARQGLRPNRPLTHELMGDLLTASGVEIARVVIDELRDGIYYATVDVRTADGQQIWVDARPSDSLALAVRERAPILLAPRVVESSPDWSDPEQHVRPDQGRSGRAVQTSRWL